MKNLLVHTTVALLSISACVTAQTVSEKPATVPVEAMEILTPPPSPAPRINGPKVYGCRQGHPFLYRIPCTGQRPMTFSAEGLPAGLALDAATGIVTGTVPAKGEYTVTFKAKNSLGTSTRVFKIVAGDTLSLTPQMGWNSWYTYFNRVTAKDMRHAADLLVSSGMADAGYQFVNVDDCWYKAERQTKWYGPGRFGKQRDDKGNIIPNDDFPDMKGLADYIHAKGLKAGIYLSPGTHTCTSAIGSYGHYEQDAKQLADWGYDFLKFDSYIGIPGAEKNAKSPLPVLKRPFQEMGDILKAQSRDIVFNLCQYGWGDSFKWGKEVGGHSWRTGGDLGFELHRIHDIALHNAEIGEFGGPGGWNDPDYIQVGWVASQVKGTLGQPHPSKLTVAEQYSFMSLWCLLPAPLFYGGDLNHLDAFTLGILCNPEVIDVNQDPLGKPGRVIRKGKADTYLMVRDLEDGSKAVGLCNRGEKEAEVTADWKAMGLSGKQTVRDLWRMKDLGVFENAFSAKVPRHGVVLVKMTPHSPVVDMPADTLTAALNDDGTIKGLVWSRPGGKPVDMVFRHDAAYAGYAFYVSMGGKNPGMIALKRTAPGANEFTGTKDGITYSLAYAVRGAVLETTAKISNGSGKPFAPARASLNVGVDTQMVKYPEWNERFFPTLLRCEKTHFWGYFLRPDGIILGIASPDPVVSWANAYFSRHFINTGRIDLLTTVPQPERHPKNTPLAPGESRQWKICLVPMDKLEAIQPTLAAAAGVPMIALDRTAVEEGGRITGKLSAVVSPVTSLTITDPDGKAVEPKRHGDDFSFEVGKPGVYTLHAKTADGKDAEALAACRMPWSWYLKQGRANAVAKPQKATGNTETWMGLLTGYDARRYFPDADLDKAMDAKYAELAPLMYDLKAMKPTLSPFRSPNHTNWAALEVRRYRATGDIRNLEFAASLADFMVSMQTPKGFYRGGFMKNKQNVDYTCIFQPVKCMMEVMAAEKPLADKDPAWKARYDRHAESVRKAADHMERSLDNIETEGEMTYEDCMIGSSATQLAMYALLQTDPATRAKYTEAAKTMSFGHRCLSQIIVPDCRVNGGSLRFWESQYDILTRPNMIESPHGWSAWQLYGLSYLYQLTGEREYLRQAMNGLSACAQLVDFKTGELRWGFIVDPAVKAGVFTPNPDRTGEQGVWVNRVIGEQYMPMISGWYRPKPNAVCKAFVRPGYPGDQTQDGGCCDNDVHEIFRCLAEIALTSAYVIENKDGSFEGWNCKVVRTADGKIDVTPAEAVVSRVHFNLATPAAVSVNFGADKQAGELKAGLQWFGPGGIPEELRH